MTLHIPLLGSTPASDNLASLLLVLALQWSSMREDRPQELDRLPHIVEVLHLKETRYIATALRGAYGPSEATARLM